jgi:acetoacetyl-CoA reductase
LLLGKHFLVPIVILYTFGARAETWRTFHNARFGATANCVCPGFTDTDMLGSVPEPIRERLMARVPLGRFAQPEEVARAVVFVAGEGGYMTGTCLDINGGLFM